MHLLRRGYMAGITSKPVKVFKTLHDRQSYILSKFHKIEKKTANLNYHVSIKKSQAILKCFTDLKYGIAFGLRWAQKTKTCFVTLRTFFSLTVGQSLQNTK